MTSPTVVLVSACAANNHVLFSFVQILCSLLHEDMPTPSNVEILGGRLALYVLATQVLQLYFELIMLVL